jgi:oxaloacetate decarboxylase beta subunit
MNKKLIASLLISLLCMFSINVFASDVSHTISEVKEEPKVREYHSKTIGQLVVSFYETTGINALINPSDNVMTSEPNPEHARLMTTFEQTFGRIIMFGICILLFYLAIAKGFEPLLLLPIAFGGLLANIPLANMGGAHGMLGIIYNMGIANEFFPLLIFMGVGAMTDFSQ